MNNQYEKYEQDGFKVKSTHSGQKKAYGDTYREFEIISAKPASDVEKFCSEVLYKAQPYDEWLAIYRSKDSTMAHAFSPHYKFRKMEENKYFYQVELMYTD
ncbi:MAG: hypothetical protein E2O79_09985 [Caldithrix sp.]|nr:MAG: hypothetical protein E2O79_09985 [Caldithrix sp.]